jgi:hypothetical protein
MRWRENGPARNRGRWGFGLVGLHAGRRQALVHEGRDRSVLICGGWCEERYIDGEADQSEIGVVWSSGVLVGGHFQPQVQVLTSIYRSVAQGTHQGGRWKDALSMISAGCGQGNLLQYGGNSLRRYSTSCISMWPLQ